MKTSTPVFEDVPMEAYERQAKPVPSNSRGSGFVPIANAVERTRKHQELVRTYGISAFGESTGISSLDRILGQYLEPGRLVMLAAQPGFGKSSLLAQMMLEIAGRGGQVALWSGEMSDISIVQRLVALVGRLHYGRVRHAFRNDDGTVDETGAAAVEKAMAYLSKLGIFIDEERDLSPEEIARRTSVLADSQPNLRVLIIDHMTALGVDPSKARMNKEQQATEALKTLAGLAHRLGIVVIVAAHLNRAGSKSGVEPVITDIRDTGNVENLADVVCFIHDGDLSPSTRARLEKNGTLAPWEPTGNERFVYTAKVKDGPLGFAVLRWIPEQLRFSDFDEEVWGTYTPPESYTPEELNAKNELAELHKLLRYR